MPWTMEEGRERRAHASPVGRCVGAVGRARWPRWCAPLCVLATMACHASSPPVAGDGSGSGSTSDATRGADGTSSTSPTTALDTTAAASGPPVVIDIGFDALLLLEGESVVLTAVVVDPDDDVVSGELHGPGTPSLYGPFEPDLADRWRVAIGWDQVQAHMPLDFEGEQQLPFTLRFEDAQGQQVEAETSVRALCGGLRTTACDGVCVDLQVDDDHCGGCDQLCAVGSLEGSTPLGGCGGGTCQPYWWECAALEPATTCVDRCLAQGARCVDGGCEGATVMTYATAGTCATAVVGVPVDVSCRADLSSEPSLDPATVEVRCCCV